MTPDAAFSLQQFIGAWKLICSNEQQYGHEALPGLEMVFAGLASPFFNVGFATGEILSAEELEDRARRALAWALPRRAPWFFAITRDLLADGIDAVGVLERCGLVPAMELTGMHASDVAPLARAAEGLQLRTPQDDPSCQQILEINGAAYGIDLTSLGSRLGCRETWPHHFPVVGSVDGEPVCSAAVLMVEGLRYVALVATAPRRQRKGYAEAAVRHALALAAQQHGVVPTFLHATDAGKPVYQRMGYRETATHLLYMDARFAHG
ncbi:MAG: GNAT family N-acetyltransferase [Bryobacterales bacterium]|jgi:GNAT superfamily N-acetyltransferase|nr:GNAT family N-acetyltransferase [Bryobacterales bacterium]